MFGLFKKKNAQPKLLLTPEEQALDDRRNRLRREWRELYHRHQRDSYHGMSLANEALSKAREGLAWEAFKRADEEHEAMCRRLQERARTALLRTSSDEAVSS